MTIRFKLVALALVLATVAVPASALASCWKPTTSSAPQDCPPGCEMMAMMHHDAPAAVQGQQPSNNCCDISAGKSAPATQVIAPSIAVVLASPRVVTAAVTVRPVRQESEAAPPLVSAPSQAGLCTFLI